MTIEKDYQELIYAFAIGCLDFEEQSAFLDYQSQNPNFYRNELNEYQNLAALLPSILTIENPEANLKLKVAKKLYSFKDEIRAKKKKLTLETIESEPEKKVHIENIEHEKPKLEIIEDVKKTIEQKEEMVKEKDITDTENIEVVTPERKTKEIFRSSQTTQIQGRDLKSFLKRKKKTVEDKIISSKEIQKKDGFVVSQDEIKLEQEKPKKKVVKETTEKQKKSTYVPYRERRTYAENRSKNYTPIIFLLFIIMTAGFIWIHFSTSSRISKLQQDVNRLTYQISSLTTSFRKNNDLQEILTTKNVRVVNLSPTRLGNKSYGKLIISFDKNKGFYQMFNMPKLEKSMSYQLWVNVSRSYFSLGVFTPNGNSEYYPFKLPQLSGKQTIKFLVSKEQKLGAERPGKLIYMNGRL